MEPPISSLTQAFWDATRDEQLLLQWCTSCEQPIFYPRHVCPRCLGGELEWRPASGRGAVYAVSVQYHGTVPAFAGNPYAVALVELTEGVRLMSNVIGCDPEAVTVGMQVEVAWEPLSDGRNLPQFVPVAQPQAST